MHSLLSVEECLVELSVARIPRLTRTEILLTLGGQDLNFIEEFSEALELGVDLQHRVLDLIVHLGVPRLQQEEHAELVRRVLVQRVLDRNEILRMLHEHNRTRPISHERKERQSDEILSSHMRTANNKTVKLHVSNERKTKTPRSNRTILNH